MSFESRITRLPHAYDPDRGAEALEIAPWATGDIAKLLHGTAGCSPYLSGLLGHVGDWLEQALHKPEDALATEIARLSDVPASSLARELRIAKRRVALLLALADLSGVWPLETITQRLTDFADAACAAALRAPLAQLIARGKMPGLSEDDLEIAGGMVIFAMGKMGAGELNYSSDIDLICLFDESRFDSDDFHDARTGFIKATRAMSATLSDLTGDGYVFRTDLRLRPDPAVTPVCIAMEAAERYYESLGRTWERAAYIKARPAVGDIIAGDRFLKTLTPFVWRKHLDFAAIQDAHDMRLRIRAHKGLGGHISLEDHNMKLGRGGIREIEFFTQTRQLIAGGRDPDLRVRGTCDGLRLLAEKGWIADDVSTTLIDHYRAHRDVEHRVQMIGDAQTHNLPKDADGFARLAAFMGTDVVALRKDLTARLEEVHELTEGFFAPSQNATLTDDELGGTLNSELIDGWTRYPALRSDRAEEIFARLRPSILSRLSRAARPDEALAAFDGFLKGLPAGVQLFSLFEANPQLIDLLIDIVATSPALASYLSRNAQVFDAVIGGAFFAEWPAVDALKGDLENRLSTETDYERKLDATRRWAKEWHFRIGVHVLRGLVSAKDAGTQYADLAEASLSRLYPHVCNQFAEKHGPPPGRGAAVVGMGSLGAGRLHALSDLDVIVIYDADGIEESQGKRPLPSRTYYARLTQAMITAVTAPMAEGRLYEMDMRLRPSGNQGPVATSLASFDNYQRNEAWTWEHLALTRARVIVGATELSKDIETLRASLLTEARSTENILKDVADMRTRISASKDTGNLWDAKLGSGFLQDIELFSQAALLVRADTDRTVSSGLDCAFDLDWVTDEQRAIMNSAYSLCWSVQLGSRLLSESPLRPDLLGKSALSFLLRLTGFDDLDMLEKELVAQTSAAAAVIETVLPVSAGEE